MPIPNYCTETGGKIGEKVCRDYYYWPDYWQDWARASWSIDSEHTWNTANTNFYQKRFQQTRCVAPNGTLIGIKELGLDPDMYYNNDPDFLPPTYATAHEQEWIHELNTVTGYVYAQMFYPDSVSLCRSWNQAFKEQPNLMWTHATAVDLSQYNSNFVSITGYTGSGPRDVGSSCGLYIPDPSGGEGSFLNGTCLSGARKDDDNWGSHSWDYDDGQQGSSVFNSECEALFLYMITERNPDHPEFDKDNPYDFFCDPTPGYGTSYGVGNFEPWKFCPEYCSNLTNVDTCTLTNRSRESNAFYSIPDIFPNTPELNLPCDCHLNAYDLCGVCDGTSKSWGFTLNGYQYSPSGVCNQDCNPDNLQYYDQCGVCNGPARNNCLMNPSDLNLTVTEWCNLPDNTHCFYDSENDTCTLDCGANTGECDEPVQTYGCTDQLACNYDPTANADDGSCTYVDQCGDCDGDGPQHECENGTIVCYPHECIGSINVKPDKPKYPDLPLSDFQHDDPVQPFPGYKKPIVPKKRWCKCEIEGPIGSTDCRHMSNDCTFDSDEYLYHATCIYNDSPPPPPPGPDDGTDPGRNVIGCTDPNSCNYDPNALECHDGTRWNGSDIPTCCYTPITCCKPGYGGEHGSETECYHTYYGVHFSQTPPDEIYQGCGAPYCNYTMESCPPECPEGYDYVSGGNIENANGQWTTPPDDDPQIIGPCSCECTPSITPNPDYNWCDCREVDCRTDCDPLTSPYLDASGLIDERCCYKCCEQDEEEGDGPILNNTCACEQSTVCEEGFIWCDGSILEEGCILIGDANNDGNLNVLDVVALANCILGSECQLNSCNGHLDMNSDGSYDVMDLVAIVNCLLSGGLNCPTFRNLILQGRLKFKPLNRDLEELLQEMHRVLISVYPNIPQIRIDELKNKKPNVSFHRELTRITGLINKWVLNWFDTISGLTNYDAGGVNPGEQFQSLFERHITRTGGFYLEKSHNDRTDCENTIDDCFDGYVPICFEDDEFGCECTCTLQDDSTYGCTDETACNYNADALIDDGSCWYAEAGCICDDGPDATADCLGECNGNAVIDDCGICNGNNQDMDPCGVCHTGFVEDNHGNCCPAENIVYHYADTDCDGTSSLNADNYLGCYNTVPDNWGCWTLNQLDFCEGPNAGQGVVDQCLTCFSDTYPDDIENGNYPEGWNACSGCTYDTACNYMHNGTEGTCNSGALPGDADYCIDDGSCIWPNYCEDCNGDCLDLYYGECDPDCNGDCGLGAVVDECGNCGLNAYFTIGGEQGGVSCTQGTPNCLLPNGNCDCAGNQEDECGVCGGSGVLDECDVCDGPGKCECENGPPTCECCCENGTIECDGWCYDPGSELPYIDNCGTCVGGETGLLPCEQDCAGNWGGSLELDLCNICDGSNLDCTYETWGTSDCPNMDCNGTCFGNFAYDECDVCTDTPGIFGCMDPDACNYNSDATCDEFSVSRTTVGKNSVLMGTGGNGDLEGGHSKYYNWPWFMSVKAPYTYSFIFKPDNFTNGTSPPWINIGLETNWWFKNSSSGNNFQVERSNLCNDTANSGPWADDNHDTCQNLTFDFDFDMESMNGNWNEFTFVAVDNPSNGFEFYLYLNGIPSTSNPIISATTYEYQDWEDFRFYNGLTGQVDSFRVWESSDVYDNSTKLFNPYIPMKHNWLFGDHENDTPNDSDQEFMINSVTVDAAWMDKKETLIGNNCALEPCYQQFGTTPPLIYATPGGEGGLEAEKQDWDDGDDIKYRIYLGSGFLDVNDETYNRFLDHQMYKIVFDVKTTLNLTDTLYFFNYHINQPPNPVIEINNEWQRVGFYFFNRCPNFAHSDCEEENCTDNDHFPYTLYDPHFVSDNQFQLQNITIEHLPGRAFVHRDSLTVGTWEYLSGNSFYVQNLDSYTTSETCYFCHNDNCDGFPSEYYDCDGICNSDSDSDGICDNVDDCDGTWEGCGCNLPFPSAPQVCNCPDLTGTCTSNSNCETGEMCIDYEGSKHCAPIYDICGICGGNGIVDECGGPTDESGNYFCSCKGNSGAAADECPILDCAGNCGYNVDGDSTCSDDSDCGLGSYCITYGVGNRCASKAILDDCGDCYCPPGVYPQVDAGTGELYEVVYSWNGNQDTCGICPSEPYYDTGVCIDVCGQYYADGSGDGDWESNCCTDVTACNGPGSFCENCEEGYGEYSGGGLECLNNQTEDGNCCRAATGYDCDGNCIVGVDDCGVCGGTGVSLICFDDTGDGDGLGSGMPETHCNQATCSNGAGCVTSEECISIGDEQCISRCNTGWVLQPGDYNDSQFCVSNSWDLCGNCIVEDGEDCIEFNTNCPTYNGSTTHYCNCSSQTLDLCGVCGGDNSTCDGCTIATACNYNADAVVACNSGSENDCCTYPTAPNDCGGNCCTAGNTNPECDYHGAGYEVDFDCAGVCNGSSTVDDCGVCGGDNSTCKDCALVVNGTSYIDDCGDCVCGDDSTGGPIEDGTEGCIAEPCLVGCDGVGGSGKVFKECCDYAITGIERCLPYDDGSTTNCATVVECGCTYSAASNTTTFTGGLDHFDDGTCTFDCTSASLQCWYEDNNADSYNTYYDDYSTFLTAACGGTSGWCDDALSWYDESGCWDLVDGVIPTEFTFLRAFYDALYTGDDEAFDWNGDGTPETHTWLNLDHWLVGDDARYNLNDGVNSTADYPQGPHNDLFGKLEYTKDVLVAQAAQSGIDWGNDVWCKAQYGLLDSGDTSNCTNDDSYCDYSVNCPLWDEANDGTADYMLKNSCDNWCIDGSCQSCPPDDAGATNSCYSSYMLSSTCDNWCLNGSCSTCPATDNTTFLSNCVGANGDWMIESTCDGYCNAGSCAGSYGQYMTSASCDNWCVDGSCSACPPDDNGATNSCYANYMLSTSCDNWCVDGSCSACPPDDAGATNSCYADYMLSANCDNWCTDGSCSACPPDDGGATNSCYANYMLSTSCDNWCVDGSCSACPPDDNGATNSCYSSYMLSTNCDNWCINGSCSACPPDDDGATNTCYANYMLSANCDNWCVDGSCSACPPDDETNSCYDGWVNNPASNGWFYFACVGGTAEDCSDGTVYNSIGDYCEFAESGGDCDLSCYENGNVGWGDNGDSGNCEAWAYANTTLIYPADILSYDSGTDGPDYMLKTSCDNWCVDGSCSACPPNDATNTCYSSYMLSTSCDNWCIDGSCSACPPDDNGATNSCYANYMLSASCDNWCIDGSCSACPPDDNGATNSCYANYMLSASCDNWCIDGSCSTCPSDTDSNFITNCVTGGNWMLSASCDNWCTNGSCSACPPDDNGATNSCYADYMLSASCDNWCIDGSCSACPPDDDGATNSCYADYMLSTSCDNWCVDGSCSACPPNDATNSCYADYMLSADCDNWCVDGSCSACPDNTTPSSTTGCYADNCHWDNFTDQEKLETLNANCNWEHLTGTDEKLETLNANCNWEHLTGTDEQLQALNENCNWEHLTGTDEQLNVLTTHCPGTEAINETYCQYSNYCDDHGFVATTDITTTYCTTPGNIYADDGSVPNPLIQLYTQEQCISNFADIIADNDFDFLTSFYIDPNNANYTDSNGTTYVDLDAWIIATGTATTYLGDTFNTYCEHKDYVSQNWCVTAYELDTDYCQQTHELIPKIDYEDYDFEFSAGYQVISYPLAPEFKDNINTSAECNFLTILEESFSNSLSTGDLLIITKGGAGQTILGPYNSGWGGDFVVNAFLSYFSDNPASGIIFKTGFGGTISWKLNSECIPEEE